MGNLRACLAVATIALAACGDDGGSATKNDAAVDTAPSIDAAPDGPPVPVFDFTCVGAPAPTVPATIALSGFAQQADVNGAFMSEVTPIEGGTVTVCTTTACSGGGLDTATTVTGGADAGDWSITGIETGAAPFNAYLELEATNYRTTYVYPGMPFTADQPGVPILTFGSTLLGFLEQFIPECDAAGPLLVVAATDCANAPITDTANVDIIVKQNGTPVSTAEVTDLSTIPMAPPQVAGLFLVCGVPANDTTEVSAMYQTNVLVAHNVKMVAGTTTTTQLTPGY